VRAKGPQTSQPRAKRGTSVALGIKFISGQPRSGRHNGPIRRQRGDSVSPCQGSSLVGCITQGGARASLCPGLAYVRPLACSGRDRQWASFHANS